MLRKHLPPALIISCIALFVALGGVSYGVATGFIDSREIRNNTVRSADVRNNSLRTFDIRNNEIRGFDIRNSSVQGRDLAFNTVTGADIAEDRGQTGHRRAEIRRREGDPDREQRGPDQRNVTILDDRHPATSIGGSLCGISRLLNRHAHHYRRHGMFG